VGWMNTELGGQSLTVQRDSKRWTQTSYLLKLVIPTTNALPRWRLNVETKTKCMLHGSHRLSFNEPTNAKKSCDA